MCPQQSIEVERQGKAKSTTPRTTLLFQGKEDELPGVEFERTTTNDTLLSRRALYQLRYSAGGPAHRYSILGDHTELPLQNATSYWSYSETLKSHPSSADSNQHSKENDLCEDMEEPQSFYRDEDLNTDKNELATS
ncbi:hypothetical protein GBAR_LOCUS14788 [Geodia barretti]|uniref:Uncharacterized protein n=1 Tax=Geodia barretti TaxID=519541 RepID=A0AA35WT76_GEOBA|nr:hypothetical protein GBAR_LOCUS14788 [Geodia barretti]